MNSEEDEDHKKKKDGSYAVQVLVIEASGVPL